MTAKKPFASAHRTQPRRTPAATLARKYDTAKTGLSGDTYGKDRLSVRLVLQVWESVDGLRRALLEPAGAVVYGEKDRRQTWRMVRVRRGSVEIDWSAAEILATTLHQQVGRAHGRMKLWLIYGR